MNLLLALFSVLTGLLIQIGSGDVIRFWTARWISVGGFFLSGHLVQKEDI